MKKFASKPGARPARTTSERPARRYERRDDAPAPARRPARSAAGPARPPRETYGDPYQRAQRPPRPARRDEAEGAPPRPYTPRGAGGFTVHLDPDVARVFRGDASVNKALRLVIQMMQVVQGPPPRAGFERRAPGPREAARGSRPARFEDDGE